MLEEKQSNSKQAYTNIFKSTSLFGGVQVFTILISIVRSKIVAILLGPSGMGIIGLFTNTTELIKAISSLGVERSAVKNISTANISSDTTLISKTYLILKRIIWITGIIGGLIMILFSKQLSVLTFGNSSYTYGFIILSSTILINQLTGGNLALLRGLRKLKFMAKCSMWGAFLGLIISIPIYYYFGEDGIVPAIVLSSLIALFISNFFKNKISLVLNKPDKEEVLETSRDMIKMGVILTLSSLMSLVTSYAIRVYVRFDGDLSDVGYYNASFTLVNTYFGLIFTSLTTDYYPKLSAIANNNFKAIKLMNQQSEMTILIISPILVIFLVFIEVIIPILYTEDFLIINKLVIWSALGIFFKAAAWSLSIIFISKGHGKMVLVTEIISNLALCFLSLYFYSVLGLEGIGVAYFLSQVVLYLVIYVIVNTNYEFSYEKHFKFLFTPHFIFGLICFSITYFVSSPLVKYLLGSLVIIFSCLFSLYELNKRMNITDFLKKFKR